jgi:two-component system CheB/CheR fusion protein
MPNAPFDLADAGLEDALRRLVTDAEEAYGIPCLFHATGSTESLPSKTAIQLYHIAQEALSNAARHAGPSRIEVRLTLHGHRGELAIEDDGAGLPEDAGIHRGMGLQIMRHRATVIGGELDIHKRNGGGTRVVCRFDFSSPQQSDIG